ncbi:MAG TPA: glycosyltransferase family 4 protein [Gemmatimonadaceae bacterium]
MTASRPASRVEAARLTAAGLRVCMLATDVDGGGGVARQSYALLRRLSEAGVQTTLYVRNYSGKPRLELRNGTTIRRAPVIGRFRFLNAALYLVYAGLWLVRNRRQYDVVHAQQMSGAAIVGLLARRVTGAPLLIRVTSSGESGEVSEVGRLPLARIRRRLLRTADRWVALTRAMKEELVEFGVPPQRIAVIPNGSELPEGPSHDAAVRSAARDRLGLPQGRIVLYAGRLSSEKGLECLLRAWARIEAEEEGAWLLLLGAGGAYRSVEAELRALAADLRLARVRFCGHVSNVGEHLLASDVFVLPSRTEGMSNALVEAMGAGIAIVASDIPANREILANEENALLFPPDDEDALVLALRRLFVDPALALRLAAAARAHAERELSATVMAARYLEQYASMVREKPMRDR